LLFELGLLEPHSVVVVVVVFSSVLVYGRRNKLTDYHEKDLRLSSHY